MLGCKGFDRGAYIENRKSASKQVIAELIKICYALKCHKNRICFNKFGTELNLATLIKLACSKTEVQTFSLKFMFAQIQLIHQGVLIS